MDELELMVARRRRGQSDTRLDIAGVALSYSTERLVR
jgi:hypothetical protein